VKIMADQPDLHITDTVTIPMAELQFHFSRSGGPGGQHVNRTATQVELTFDVQQSARLDEAQRARVLSRLKSAIDSRGVLHLTCQATRSQARNRTEVTERFQRLLRRALHVPKPRRPTRPGRAAAERRLQGKRRVGMLKQERRQQSVDE
jgi:ribosome-associated protein